jgi:hypothetical protein
VEHQASGQGSILVEMVGGGRSGSGGGGARYERGAAALEGAGLRLFFLN